MNVGLNAALAWPVLLCLAAGFGTLYLIYYLLQYRDKPGALWFAGAMGAQAVFLFSYGVGLTVFDPQLRWGFEVLALVALVWVGPPFLGFALEYTGRGEVRRSWYYWILYVFPIGTAILLPLNGWHGLFWTGFTVESLFGVAAVAYDIGLLMYIVMVGSLAASTGGILLLVETIWDYGSLFRSETLAVVLSPLLPAIGLVVWLFQLTPYSTLNWAAPLFVWHVAFDLFAFVGKGMFEIHPATNRAAKQSALESFRAPVIVLEEEGRVVEMNPAAEEQLDLDREETLLRPASAVIDEAVSADWSDRDTLERYLEDETEWHVTVQTGSTRAEYSVQPSPLTAAGNEHVGYTLLFQDITEEKQREERLSVLNRILRHNLRNDLSIVSGYISAADSHNEDELVAQMLDKVSTTVNDLIETGEMARDFEKLLGEPRSYTREVDIETAVEDQVARLSSEHPEASISSDFESVGVETNPDIFNATVWQVLENAAVHSGNGSPTVMLSVDETDDEVIIEIVDDGPGIPEHELRSLRKGEETSLDHGSGFGLWLVKWGAARIGGSVEFDSDETGTTVRLTLPKNTGRVATQTSSASA